MDNSSSLLAALGNRVRTLRAQKNWTRRTLSLRCGLSERFLAQLEGGKGNISISKLAALCQTLDEPLPLLVGWADLAAGSQNFNGANRWVHAVRGLGWPIEVSGPAQASGRALPALREYRIISLLGLRGAGKSTLGPLLAEKLKRPYVELDERISERSGLSLTEMFELHGEAYYRQLEREALAALLGAESACVVAVSGGIVTDPECMGMLARDTLSVWITATPEQHMGRVRAQGDNRPMKNRPNAMAELIELLASRGPLYAKAALRIDTNGSPTQCVGRLLDQLFHHGDKGAMAKD